jgi:phage/plasmid-like protein (TIGR03299 family)
MAAGITNEDSMVSGNNVVPWHKLGVVVAGLMTAKECIKKAGLEWEVKGEPMFDTDGKEIPEFFANIRQDTRRCLGVVKGRYNIIQNGELFEFFDNVVSQGESVYETAGSLHAGRMVWMLCKLNESMKVRGDDFTNYAMLYTSHDGTKPLIAKMTNVRCVCQNTISAALNGAGNEIRIRHTKSYQSKVDEAQRVLGIVKAHGKAMKKTLEALAKRKMDADAANLFLASLVPGESKQAENMRESIFSLYRNGKGNEGKSAYDMLNGITEYVDHGRTSRVHGDKNPAEVRFESVLLGSGDRMKANALDMLMALAS